MTRSTLVAVALLSLVCAPCPVHAAAPPNDLWANAITVGASSTTAGTTLEATVDGAAVCGTTQTGPGVWYHVVSVGGIMTADTCSYNDFDTKVSVYLDNGATCVAGNDDDCSLGSRVSWPGTAGTSYYILVHGYGDAVGNFTLTVATSLPPANDACAGAESIGSVPYATSLNTTLATSAPDDPVMGCGTEQNSNTVWYRITPAGSGLLTATTAGSNYDTVLAVLTGSCGSLTSIACSDDGGGGLQSAIADLPVTAGTTYYIEAADYGMPNGGSLTLGVTVDASVLPGITVTPASGLTTTEAGGTATFTVALATQPAGDVVIDVVSQDLGEGTASPAQLTFTGTTWAAPQTVTVTGVDDAAADGDQGYTVAVSMNAATADPAYAALDPSDVSVTNTDDDPASLAFVVQPSTTPAWRPIAPAPVVQVLDAEGRPVASSGAFVTLALGTNPSGGTLSGTLAVAAVGGVATFADLWVDRPGAGYTLVATSPGLEPATSDPFEVTELTSVPALGPLGIAGLLVLLAAAGALALRRLS